MNNAQIETIIELTNRGLSAQDIAEELNMTDRTVYRYLRGDCDHLMTERQVARMADASGRYVKVREAFKQAL